AGSAVGRGTAAVRRRIVVTALGRRLGERAVGALPIAVVAIANRALGRAVGMTDVAGLHEATVRLGRVDGCRGRHRLCVAAVAGLWLVLLIDRAAVGVGVPGVAICVAGVTVRDGNAL